MPTRFGRIPGMSIRIHPLTVSSTTRMCLPITLGFRTVANAKARRDVSAEGSSEQSPIRKKGRPPWAPFFFRPEELLGGQAHWQRVLAGSPSLVHAAVAEGWGCLA